RSVGSTGIQRPSNGRNAACRLSVPWIETFADQPGSSTEACYGGRVKWRSAGCDRGDKRGEEAGCPTSSCELTFEIGLAPLGSVRGRVLRAHGLPVGGLERAAAAAGRDRIGVIDLEAGAHRRLDVI